MTTRYWDEDTSGEVHLVHSSQAGDRSRSSGYDSDSSDGSNNSMTTIGSDEAGDYFREIHGRRFPVADNLPLALPVDNEELLRFDLRHASIKLLMGGNQWTPIVEALAPVRGRRRRVLDICTRSGTWVKELASERPDVDFVSVDIAPVAPHTPSANIEFEVYNVLEGIHAQDASFDLVYCSSTMTTTELEVYDASDPQLVRPANNAPGLSVSPGSPVVNWNVRRFRSCAYSNVRVARRK
ncbi:Methyltransferase domain [Rhizoctonia solani]|uniref:Methyltransferase domain n=1 Tax=Rhizoctonia solani TaxID=456999 RepID=A0A8H7I6B1_9AGAM|nr:Methyltransferase domain [Rhizoctonia solani]